MIFIDVKLKNSHYYNDCKPSKYNLLQKDRMWGRMSGKKQTTTKPRPVGRNPAAKEPCTRARMGTGCQEDKGGKSTREM